MIRERRFCWFQRCTLLILGLCVTAYVSGCGTLPNGRGWGQDATLFPGWERVKQAAYNAAVAPETWVPAAGALAFQVGHADKELSEWASKNTPVFGSMGNAEHASDYLLDAAGIAYFSTALATPSGDEPGEWVSAKAKGITVGVAAVTVNAQVTGLLKRTAGRTRPDGSDNKSFPSGHSSTAAVYATLASRNVDSLSLSDGAATASKIGLGLLTAGTAWARVEAQKHYPSDVLAGAALGHFFGAFINDAFLGVNDPHNVMPIIEPSREGVTVAVRFNF